MRIGYPLLARSAISFAFTLDRRLRSLIHLPSLIIHGRKAAPFYRCSGQRIMEDQTRSWPVEVEMELGHLRCVVPELSPSKHKGQAGKVGVIGGCREYTGAPFFAAFSALKIGADISHVFCTQGAGTAIKCYSPEVIVHPVLFETHDFSSVGNSLSEAISDGNRSACEWIQCLDCLVIGPGLGRDPKLLNSVGQIMRYAREKNIPMVIDGDGLFLVTSSPSLVSGYPLAVLTPNVNEYKRLVAIMNENYSKGTSQLQSLANWMGGVTIVQKGETDHISDGNTVHKCDHFGSPRRCGGQGDVLSGCIAVFVSWARKYFNDNDGAAQLRQSGNQAVSSNPMVIGALGGSILVRKAAADAFAKCKRSTLATDIIEALPHSMESLFPSW